MDRLRDYLKAHATNNLVRQGILDEAARKFGLSHHLVEDAALVAGILPVRYQRNLKTLSIEQQLALFRSRVGVVGCGGLGGFLIEELARLGVGTIVAVDPDKFEEHNLNRQILCTLETLGIAKVAAAVERVRRINPAVTLVPIGQAFNADNASVILHDCDVIADALDSISVRIELAKFCSRQSVPLVHGAIAGWYGQIAVQFAGEETVINLLNNCRDKTGIEKEIGNPAFAPAFVAALQTAEICKIITSNDKAMSGRILFIDLQDMQFKEISIGCPPLPLL